VAVIRARIAALPERQRLALFLRYYADLDYAAIGEALEIAPGTVAATLNAAHTRLAHELQEVREWTM
jgi:RNA polymerase sigma factor (sigma-70 family)